MFLKIQNAATMNGNIKYSVKISKNSRFTTSNTQMYDNPPQANTIQAHHSIFAVEKFILTENTIN